ncbi:MAG: glycosyltransferase family 39 protein [Proteobacteria bacterium]|nr:glycosyltransferase family 39 protein [Pseudomonadota bacterium]
MSEQVREAPTDREAERSPRDGSSSRPLVAALATALAAGATLRLYRTHEQILTGDELHTVFGAVTRPVAEILRTWTYYGADYCVPLTALFRGWMDLGFALDEMAMRAPVLLAGLALVLVVPWLLRRELGDAATGVLAWLLATSPLLVLYSRIIRSYLPMVLLAMVAVLAFLRWWRSGSRPAGVAYAVCAPLAVYFHLGAAPLVATPFAFAAVELLADRRDWRRRLGRLVALGASSVVMLALWLWPAHQSLLDLFGLHGGGESPGLRVWWDIVRLQAGTTSVLLCLAMLAAMVRGGWLLWQRDRATARYWGSLALGHLLGLLLLSPNKMEHLVVGNRYLLPLLPLGLALVALGVVEPLRTGRLSVRAQWSAAALLWVALFATGPFATRDFHQSAFVHARPFLTFVHPGNRVDERDLPAFYASLVDAEDENPGPIVEAPWLNLGYHPFDAYQKWHGRPVLAASTDPNLWDERLRLRNMVKPTANELLASPAHHVVVHRDIAVEERRVHTSDSEQEGRLLGIPKLWKMLRRGGTILPQRLREEWGPPDYADADIAVWDLERIRAGRRL